MVSIFEMISDDTNDELSSLARVPNYAATAISWVNAREPLMADILRHEAEPTKIEFHASCMPNLTHAYRYMPIEFQSKLFNPLASENSPGWFREVTA
jgi:hypothetical protein